MKKELLLFTDFKNNQDGEDKIVAEKIQDLYNITFANIDNILDKSTNVDGILIRNNWPAFGAEQYFLNRLPDIYRQLKRTKISCYNNLNAKGDMQGKGYLETLFKKDYPVIPSILSITDIDLLPDQATYAVKPLYGFDSWGFEVLSKNNLLNKDTTGQIIQPFVNIAREIHNVFIDNKYVYSFSAKNRQEDPMPDDIVYCEVPNELIQMAQRFIDWNNQAYGLQRIDIVETEDGKFYLNELEDHSPYLWIQAMPENIQDKFFEMFRVSLQKWLN